MDEQRSTCCACGYFTLLDLIIKSWGEPTSKPPCLPHAGSQQASRKAPTSRFSNGGDDTGKREVYCSIQITEPPDAQANGDLPEKQEESQSVDKGNEVKAGK